MRFLRLRRRWTQAELAARAGLSRDLVSRIERDDMDAVAIGAMDRLAGALGARAVVDLQWSGVELDRLLDAGHAVLAEWLAGRLTTLGWLVRAEVSSNHYGDRGRYDLLAFHPASGLLLVVEVKTVLGDLQGLLGRLDVKMRLALPTAAQLGWRPRGAIPLLLLADGTTNRRHVASHPVLFGRFPTRGRAALAWLRSPMTVAAPVGLLHFRKLPNAVLSSVISRHRARKRQVRPGAAVGASRTNPRG